MQGEFLLGVDGGGSKAAALLAIARRLELHQASESDLERHARLAVLHARLEVSGQPVSLGAEQELALYRITQKALTNILVLAMIGIALYRNLVLGRRRGPLTPAQEMLNARLLLINTILGVVVLLFSGVITALSSGLPAG